MADQIIIELIGDPSGLKPAEEALKELSKVSEENMAAFNKTNEAVTKFIAGMAAAAKSAQSLGEAVKESSKAISQLKSGADAGADALKEMGKAAKENMEAFEKANKPIKEFNEVSKEMGERAVETGHDILSMGESAGKSVTSISKLNGIIAQGVVKEITGDYSKWTLAIQANVAKHEYLKTKMAANTEEMGLLEKAGKSGGKAYKKLAEENTGLGHSLGGVTSSLRAHGVEVGKTAKTHNGLEAAMHKLLHVSKDEKEHFTGMHVVLTAHDRTILGVVGHTKELGSAMGEMAEAVGKVTGNDKLGAEVKEKLAKAMEIVTVAQTTLTVAQEAATIAAIAFDAALWPVILVVAAVVAGVAVAASVLKALGFSFSAAGEKVREFLSFFGLVDSKKVHEAKEETERLGKEIEKNTEKQKNAVDELEAQDAAVKDIIAAKKKQLETDQALLIEQRAQAVIAGDTAKIAEIDKKLEEDKIGLIKLQTEAKKEQAKEDDEAKNKKIEDAKAAKDAYAQKLSDAKSLADAQLAATIAGSKAELAAKVNDLNAAAAVELNNARGNADMIKAIKTKLNNDIAAVNDEFNKQKEEKDRTAVQEKLNLEKKNTEVLLVLYKDDAAKTLQLSLQLAEQEKNIALTNANLTVNEKLLIEKQYNDKVKALNGAESLKEIQAIREADKEELTDKIQSEQDKLETEKAFSKEAIQLKKDIAADQMQMAIDAVNAEVTDEKEKQKKLEQIAKDYAKEIKKIDKEVSDNKDKLAKDAAEKQRELNKKLASEAVSLGKQVADAIFANQAEKRQQALDATISTLEAQKQHELSNHHLTAAQKAAIEKKYHDQEAAAKLKAWKADQKAKAEQAIINGILAFAAALATDPIAGYINGAIALATAGLQAGLILAKSPPKFAKGVIALDGPGTATSDSIPAYLSRGESVITAERTRQYKPLLEQIHAGTYEPLPIPLLSTLPRLNDIGSIDLTGHARTAGIDYEKLGRAVASALPKSKVQKLSFDKKGFSHYLLSESGKVESYNNRYRE